MSGETSLAPKLSAEIFSIPLGDGLHLVYAPLRRAAFVANATVVNFMADLDAGLFDRSVDPDGGLTALLRQLQIVDGGAEPKPVSRKQGKPAPTGVTLFMTTACNLRCSYCYASAGDTRQSFMDIDVARRGIDFVLANAVEQKRSQFELTFHGGGEPSLNWKTLTGAMDYALERAKAHDLSVYATAGTNGMLNDAQIDWMIAHLKTAVVSFDGLPAVHDKHRLTVQGRGSSGRVMHCMRRFEEGGLKYVLRMTVTADQIANLPASIEFICQNFKIAMIHIEPAYQLGRGTNAPTAETAAFIDAYRQAQAIALSFGRELYYSAARLETLTNHFCGVSRDSFCLSPNGNVSACYENFSEENEFADRFFYGRPDEVNGGYKFDMNVLDNLRRLTVDQYDYCEGCFAKWHCAGDCHHKGLAVSEGGEFLGSDRCHITRELTKDQILSRIVQSGGVFWRG